MKYLIKMYKLRERDIHKGKKDVWKSCERLMEMEANSPSAGKYRRARWSTHLMLGISFNGVI